MFEIYNGQKSIVIKKSKFFLFPYDILKSICNNAGTKFPLILLFDEYHSENFIDKIKNNSFKNINDPYDILLLYLNDIKYLEQLDFFKNSRYYMNILLKIGEYDKYINYLFYIKLYMYYLKIQLKNIAINEYIINFIEKYKNENFIKKNYAKNVENIVSLLENEYICINKNDLYEHYLFEFIMNSYDFSFFNEREEEEEEEEKEEEEEEEEEIKKNI